MDLEIPRKEGVLLRWQAMKSKPPGVSKELPLWLQLNKVSKQYMEALAARLQGLGIRRHYFLLAVIAEHGGKLTQQELANLLEIDKVSMVGILDYLAAAGFIRRRPSRTDRRKHLIVLTPKADRALPKIHRAIAELNQRALRGLPTGIAAHFSGVLLRMKRALVEAAKEYRLSVVSRPSPSRRRVSARNAVKI